MKVITVSSTDLKNKTSEILNIVTFSGKEVVVEKHGKAIARIVPEERVVKKDSKDIEKALKKTFGSIPDFPDVTKYRVSRKKYIRFDLDEIPS